MLNRLLCKHNYKIINVERRTLNGYYYGDPWYGTDRIESSGRKFTNVLHRCTKCHKLKYEEIDGHLTDEVISALQENQSC